MRIRTGVIIAAEPSTVWPWLAAPERAREWMTSVGETEIVEQRPGMIGTTFREVVRDGRGSVELHGSITAFEPDRRIAFHLESRVNELDVEYGLRPAQGCTELAVEANVRWRFPVSVIARVAPGRIDREITGQLDRELATLKKLCEGTTEPAAGTI